ncbi:MAG: AAA family ATPase [Dongiaceae bacterium]
MLIVIMERDSQTHVIEFLAEPANHGGNAVQRINTHASIVFLAGDTAYKLKRAVRYSYLDYSTVEARRRACEAEVSLNRRTAPEIYLRASPICRNARGSLQFDGDGTAVDWVVVMRRFDDDLLFDRLAQRQMLTLNQMLDLTEEIVRFHQMAEVDKTAGGADAVASVIAGNLANLSIHSPAIFGRAPIERLKDLSEKSLAKVGDLLNRRRTQGHVRLCHGDLHLRNVCLIGGRPVLFDCIEFSRELACIDVLYDLAFLLMDLEERQLRPLANAVFNRYLDLADERAGLPAIPLFLSMRATVRAHVTAAAAKLETDSDVQRRMADEARQYLRHAIAFVQPVKPILIAIGGLSGTGKTTLAYELAPRIGASPGARVLRTDVLRKRLAGQPLTARLPAAAYGEQMTQRVYDALFAEAEAMLASGHGAIVDAVFAREPERTFIEGIAARHNVPFIGLWLEAPLPIMERRVEERQADASDATVEVVHRQQTYDIGRMSWSRVDASGAASDVCERGWAAIRPLLARH